MHPNTYVNKLVFAGGNKMQLWNVIEDTLVYEFKEIVKGKEDYVEITQVVQSPVVHTVAVGFSDGEVRLCNL